MYQTQVSYVPWVMRPVPLRAIKGLLNLQQLLLFDFYSIMNGTVPQPNHVSYGQVTVPGPPQGISSNPVAIVTGSAQGIGYAIAVRLAADGFDVALNDLPSKSDALTDAVKTIKALGRRAISVPADVTKEEEVVQMIDETVRLLGGLDVVSKRFFISGMVA